MGHNLDTLRRPCPHAPPPHTHTLARRRNYNLEPVPSLPADFGPDIDVQGVQGILKVRACVGGVRARAMGGLGLRACMPTHAWGGVRGRGQRRAA